MTAAAVVWQLVGVAGALIGPAGPLAGRATAVPRAGSVPVALQLGFPPSPFSSSSSSSGDRSAGVVRAPRTTDQCKVDIEVTGVNSRGISSSIIVDATPAYVWSILTGAHGHFLRAASQDSLCPPVCPLQVSARLPRLTIGR